MLQHAQMSSAISQNGVSRDRSYHQTSKLAQLGGSINITVFSDVLELDDDEEENFTRSLVCDFFALAQRTFGEMELCLQTQDVKQLLMKAQFLKGPCSTLGIIKVEDACARIESLTAVADTFKTEGERRSTLCDSAKTLLDQAKINFFEAETALRKFYDMA